MLFDSDSRGMIIAKGTSAAAVACSGEARTAAAAVAAGLSEGLWPVTNGRYPEISWPEIPFSLPPHTYASKMNGSTLTPYATSCQLPTGLHTSHTERDTSSSVACTPQNMTATFRRAAISQKCGHCCGAVCRSVALQRCHGHFPVIAPRSAYLDGLYTLRRLRAWG